MQSKLSKRRQSVSPEIKGVHGWCPAVSSFSSGSLHFKGTLLLGYASLTVRLYCGSSLWNEADLDVDVRLIFCLDLDFSVRCHWLASWLPLGLAFSTLLLCVSCLHHQI